MGSKIRYRVATPPIVQVKRETSNESPVTNKNLNLAPILPNSIFLIFTHICKIFLQICVTFLQICENESYQIFTNMCKSHVVYFYKDPTKILTKHICNFNQSYQKNICEKLQICVRK
jgi:hypothetical protein